MNGDQANGLFRCQRSQPLLDLPRGKPEAARTHQIHADKIAIISAKGVGFCDVQLAPGLLLVDGNKPTAPAGKGAKNTEHASFGVVDDLDDTAAIHRGLTVLVDFFDSEQSSIAYAGHSAGLAA